MDYLYTLQTIRENFPGGVNTFFVLVSEFAAYVGPAIPLIIFLCMDKKAGSRIIFTFCAADIFANTIKIIACVYRPWVRDPRIVLAKEAQKTATGYSFPSAHTTAATTIYGETAIWQKNRKKLVIFLILMIVMTGFARNWLGAHSFTDVCVAYILSIVLMLLERPVEKWVLAGENRDFILVGIILAVSIGVVIFAALKSYPMDYGPDGVLLVDPIKTRKDAFASCGLMMGWSLCWIYYRRWGHYEVPYITRNKVYVAIGGILVIAVTYLGVGELLGMFLDVAVASFVKRFLTVIMATMVYPALLAKFFGKKLSVEL